jgi:pyruvate-ferredoxin/flavodoxin oxidoreductase
MKRKMVTIDGNEAAAYVAFKTNEVCAIYPITPSSPMGEWAEQWSVMDQKNIWGTSPTVEELQSEGGASGAVHGALQTGALTTTFTASQGLLLMIPNMYKIAGELTSTVFHVSARSLAAQALSIFGDHSDVMAARSTGFAFLASNSVQEVMDLALIAQASTLKSRIPFIHFFDGFRTSHEVMKIEQFTEDDIRGMIDDDLVIAHRNRGLNPNHPVLRGTAQNPDVYFQGRETVNPYYEATPEIVQEAMDKFASIVGRQYHLFDYHGAPDATKLIIIMGSGAEAVHETVDYLLEKGEKVGVLKVRLYRPFSIKDFMKAIPSSVEFISVLDRTKEPGATGEPLYQDVVTSFAEVVGTEGCRFEKMPKIVGGRYGLSSKEFTPAMIKAVFDNLEPKTFKNHFTIGIHDDVSHTSLEWDNNFATDGNSFGAMFYGMGSDGTVGANKNSIKIIGTETDNFAQGYFVYDSKKAGSTTVSHLRFGKDQIRSTYLIEKANFVACHNFELLNMFDILKHAKDNATFLINSPYGADDLWDYLPRHYQKYILDKHLNVYTIDALKVAQETGMGVRINTIMQTCFFAISGILPREEAITKIKDAIKKTYGLKGDDVVKKNFHAVDETLANLFQLKIPEAVTAAVSTFKVVADSAPEFVRNITATIMEGRGDDLPVSAMSPDGTWPLGTTQYEKRNIAHEIPVWEPDLCIQCNKCVIVCPHAAIRPKVVTDADVKMAPPTMKFTGIKGKEWADDENYILQVAPEDCTGCNICVEFCPAVDKVDKNKKAINMTLQRPLRETESQNWEYFVDLVDLARDRVRHDTVKGSMFLEPLFEFSGACVGCGETPYIKLATQLFGDRMVIANATGCSSIYGGNLPTTPYKKNVDGRGPAWSNSLFEDNAEFGLGYRLTIDKQAEHARELLVDMGDAIDAELVDAILNADQSTEPGIYEQRERVTKLTETLQKIDTARSKNLRSIADNLVKKSVWIIGGDGWAYDIGYGGLDHVLASGKNVNVLVLDTEVYSNTGGQTSKATPMGAVAKFSAAGKSTGKKDIGMMAMAYGNVYVASVAMGASDAQTVKAFIEAEAHPGPSIIVAYSHCVAHGYDMGDGMNQQKKAVESGYWLNYRYNPANEDAGKNPLTLDSKAPKIHVKEYTQQETRFKILGKTDPERAEMLLEALDTQSKKRYKHYNDLASISYVKEEV